SFGMAAGLAFQIQDDVLNLVGTREATKKDFRSDIAEGKRTLVAIHALQQATGSARLLEILSARETDPAALDEAVDIMRSSDSITFAEDYARALILDAKESLEAALPPSTARKLLLSMADFFVKRSS
ncbi:MAG: polyprenyl synthetase family protein, partial [Coriobacteriia bacterium]|nr:polyprenyl synthetase family protein [Coriobacteriia bacterium]